MLIFLTQFKLAADEILSLQEELNHAKESLHRMRNICGELSSTGATSSPAIVRPDESPSAPTIRVHPPSRSPSIASTAAGSPVNRNELSPLDLDLYRSIPRNPQETGGTRPMTIHGNASFHSLSSAGAEGSPPEQLFISPFGSDLAYVPSHDGSEYSHTHDDHLYASQSDGDTHPDHRNFDLEDSFLNTLVSQAPSVEDEASIAENDPTTANEDEEDDPDDADSIMAMSTTALPILRTPEPSRGLPGVQRANNAHFRHSAPTLPATIRAGPAPFLANLVVLNDLLNDPRDSVTSNTTILSRAAELLSAANLARLADNSTSGQHPVPNLIPRPRPNLPSQGFSMAEMRSCVVEVIARVFLNLASDTTIMNQPPSFASAYASRERSQQEFSGWLDSLIESDDLSNNVASFATVNSPVNSPSPPSGTNLDHIPDLIDFDS